MLGLMILLAAVGLGFIVGYGTRGVISRKRHAELLAYAPYLPPPRVQSKMGSDSALPLSPQPTASIMMRAVSSVADSVSFALALDFALVLLLILLLPKP
ncbi:hypothetical protein CWO91_11315 [Bradyrhizobium genosp. SA-3]|uniref:hypothetical protein n=1 Tax=Bradyrhizobium genosp. SA-3 TaxID=508868 RepID=UPI001029F78F|nr:hypothetical protein [Bradyrhizobium genosp. SA-3]RZN10787.1 hypothetical protein CWO91_11315 [Bradyrhizobium genosp. SA-3]